MFVGGLTVVKGSHLHLDHEEELRQSIPLEHTSLEAEIGDIVVLDTRLLHAGTHVQVAAVG